MMKKTLIGFCLAFLSLSLPGQNKNSFAVIVDTRSYEKCETELENYTRSIRNDGLDAFIVADDWATPEQVREKLFQLYTERHLEGAVFVGDIPVPMVRKAHHMTSAFKMDEDRFPMRESSVPSDRFYDDFDLTFRFIAKDSAQANLFYYELAPDSPQEITCDIYTARIKPSSKYNDPYRELSAYLKKVVRVKSARNRLDQITSYTGNGSFSNSLIAWKDETVTLSEQMPDACSRTNEPRFFVFAMQPFMKETLLKEIQRPDLDFIVFHEHGMTERQYITGYPESDYMDDYYEMGKFYARMNIRNEVRYGKTEEEALRKFAEKYKTDPSWYEDTFDPETVAADSIFDLKTGIILDDIQAAAPNVKMAIFDACYNGDFREDDWVANRYIMSDGDCIAAIGNSVNVLQDKSSSDLMGMLSAGYRIGEWMQQVNILESHIFGDPTYRFQSAYDLEMPKLDNRDCSYWLGFLDDKYPGDIQALALVKLSALDYSGMSDLLLKTYRTSPYYMTRLQCFHLQAHYKGENYREMLKEALDDPYEFIRRKACTYSGQEGSEELIDPILHAYLNDVNAKRIAFNIGFSAGLFPKEKYLSRFRELVETSDFIANKKAFIEEAESVYGSSIRMAESTEKALAKIKDSDTRPSVYMSGMRNIPYTFLAEDLLELIEDPHKYVGLRIQATEVLGWYVRAWNKEMIHDRLAAIQTSGAALPKELSEEITKTLKRLECFLK